MRWSALVESCSDGMSGCSDCLWFDARVRP
jgi:hypothetical protein